MSIVRTERKKGGKEHEKKIERFFLGGSRPSSETHLYLVLAMNLDLPRAERSPAQFAARLPSSGIST